MARLILWLNGSCHVPGHRTASLLVPVSLLMVFYLRPIPVIPISASSHALQCSKQEQHRVGKWKQVHLSNLYTSVISNSRTAAGLLEIKISTVFTGKSQLEPLSTMKYLIRCLLSLVLPVESPAVRSAPLRILTDDTIFRIPGIIPSLHLCVVCVLEIASVLSRNNLSGPMWFIFL